MGRGGRGKQGRNITVSAVDDDSLPPTATRCDDAQYESEINLTVLM